MVEAGALMRTRFLRPSGCPALLLAFIVRGIGFGWGYGTVAWFGRLTIGTAPIVTVTVNRNRITGKIR